jgi:hypothetical protein
MIIQGFIPYSCMTKVKRASEFTVVYVNSSKCKPKCKSTLKDWTLWSPK